MRWPFPLIWIVPIAAIAVAIFYFYDQHKQRGPEITVEFANANGLRPGETPVDVLGVEVGQISSTSLAADKHHVLVHIQLDAKDASIAVEGTTFWVVRADIGSGNLAGLSTVISGPYIEAAAGTGKPTTNVPRPQQSTCGDRRRHPRDSACRPIVASLTGCAGVFPWLSGWRGAGHPTERLSGLASMRRS